MAQIISLLAVPILTRLYSTDEFGVFSAYLSVVLIIVPISTLRFNSALLVAETEEQAENLLVLSLGSVVVVSAFVLLGVFAVSAVGEGEMLQAYLWLIPIGVLVQGIVQTIQFRALRAKRFHNIALAQIFESVTDRGAAIGLGLLGGYGPLGLIVGRIVGPALNAVLLIVRTSVVERPETQVINFQALLRTMSRYRDFPLFSSWAFLANSAARETPVLMLAAIYSPAIAGLYGLGLRVLNMPMMMFGDALSKVLLSRTREKRDEKHELGRLQLSAFSVVTYLGILLGIVMVAAGPDLFEVVFGKEWRDAGLYAGILSPAIMLMLGYRVTSVLFDLYEKQRQRMFFDVGLLVARVVTLLMAGIAGLSVYEGLALMMLASSILYAMGIVYLFKLVHVTLSMILSQLGRCLFLMLPSALGVLVIYGLGLDQIQLLVALIVIVMLQVTIVVVFDKQLLIRQVGGDLMGLVILLQGGADTGEVMFWIFSLSLAFLPFSYGLANFEVGIVTLTPYIVGMVLVVILAAFRWPFRPQAAFVGKHDLFIALLAITYLATTLLADNVLDAGFLAFHSLFVPVVTYFAAKAAVMTEKHYETVWMLFIVSVFIFSLYFISTFFSAEVRTKVLGVPPIGIATLTATALIIAFNMKANKMIQLMGVIIIAALLLTFSRAYLLSLLFVPLIWFLMKRGKVVIVVSSFIVATFVLTIVVAYSGEFFKPVSYDKSVEFSVERLTNIDFMLGTIYGRVQAYRDGIEQFLSAPIFGNGLYSGEYMVTQHNFHVEWLEYGGCVGYLLYTLVLITHVMRVGALAKRDRWVVANLVVMLLVLTNGVTNGLMHGVMPYMLFLLMGLNEARFQIASKVKVPQKDGHDEGVENNQNIIKGANVIYASPGRCLSAAKPHSSRQRES